MLLIVDTGWAKPVESEFMAVHHEPVLLTDVPVDAVGQPGPAQIHHRAAVSANEVAVRFRTRIIALVSVNGTDTDNLAALEKIGQVPVNCAQAEIRPDRLERRVQHLR